MSRTAKFTNESSTSLPDALAQCGGDLPVRAIAGRGGRPHEGCLRDLAELLAGFSKDEKLTLVLGPPAGARPAPVHVLVGNGLAG